MYRYKKEFTEEELLRFAEKRLELKRDIYVHIVAYIIVNAFLIFVYYFITDGNNGGKMPWFIWVLGGWGVGLLVDIVYTHQQLKLKYNTNAINKELEKIKRSLER